LGLRVTELIDPRILIVDDQVANLRVLSKVLSFAGYTNVKCLSDSREVLAAFDTFKPDLIVLDLHMPYVDGLTVMDQLAEVIDHDDYLPILVLTGDSTPAAKEKALSRGAHDFLSKPLNSTEVQLRVMNLLQTRRMHLQLKAQNESLEQQVCERTRLAEELTQINRTLHETNRLLKETNAQLIQTEKMASLGQLVAGIAHEINNPLTFVVNNLFTVENGIDHIAPEAEPHLTDTSRAKLRKVRTRLREMGEGLDQVKDLVLKLRTFSRLDEGEFKTIDIGDSIDSVLVFLKHKMNGRTQVERHYGPGRFLSCYAGPLNQALMNLIANAMDAIVGEGKITITTSQTENQFVISVRDTGIGIPESIRSRIFDPFFTTKPVGQGTGLGLAVTYGIIQDHHGVIEVHSQPGSGSEFNIRIPRDLELRRRNAESTTAVLV
jgi:two-component system NtrC family sensor kinase